MNRIDHIIQTLPKNLENCLSMLGQIEYVFLDYNSKDGIGTWIKENLKEYIDLGLLKYYRFEDRDLFDRSHSRNLAFKLAKGEIVCNVDADNFIGLGFPEFIIRIFSTERKIFASPSNVRDVLGRLCISKKQFLEYNGYDESMTGYGFEDLDLYKRLVINNFIKVTIEDRKFLQFIPHNNSYRFGNEYHGQNVSEIFLRYLEPWKSEIIFLYKNNDVNVVTLLNLEIINAQKNIEYAYETPTEKSGDELITYSEDDNAWMNGTYDHNNSNYTLTLENGNIIVLTPGKGGYFCDYQSEFKYHHITEPNFRNGLILMRSELDNRNKMDNRKAGANQNVNPMGFGKGIVTKNFSTSKIIVN